MLVIVTIIVSGRMANSGDAAELDSARAESSADVGILYHDVRTLGVEGQAWSDLESPYNRLPRKAKGAVRQRIWELAGDTSGLCVRFTTNAQEIRARWSLRSDSLAMQHMPATGVSGLDLYVKTEGGRWHWLGTGVPESQTTTAKIAEGLSAGERDYLLYLPLYNGVTSLEIGIPKSASLRKTEPRPAATAKPIVFYGTSITQGGCASRPGMTYAAILGRRFDRPIVNLGFSSNGTMDLELAALITEIDAAAIVVDCVPNMTPEMVAQRTPPFVKRVRETRPTTPILLVEDRTFADAFLVPAKQTQHSAARSALRAAYESLVAGGDQNIGYLPGDKLLADDGEDTVDGSHVTDLGFVHLSNAMRPALEKLWKKQSGIERR